MADLDGPINLTVAREISKEMQAGVVSTRGGTRHIGSLPPFPRIQAWKQAGMVLGAVVDELEEARGDAAGLDFRLAVLEQRCNGCGRPRSEWGRPVCGGMTTGDFTHFHSREFWAHKLGVAA